MSAAAAAEEYPGVPHTVAVRHYMDAMSREITRLSARRSENVAYEVRLLIVDALLRRCSDVGDDEYDPRLADLRVHGGTLPNPDDWKALAADVFHTPEATNLVLDAVAEGRVRLLTHDRRPARLWLDESSTAAPVDRLWVIGDADPVDPDDVLWLLGDSSIVCGLRGGSDPAPIKLQGHADAMADRDAAGKRHWSRAARILERDKEIADVAPKLDVGPDFRPSGIPGLRRSMVGDLMENADPLSGASWSAILTCLAQPVYLGPRLCAALRDSDVPDAGVLAAIRLPHRGQFVVPAAHPRSVELDRPYDVAIPAAPDRWPTWWLLAARSCLAAAVLFADDDGHPSGDAIVLLGSDVQRFRDSDQFARHASADPEMARTMRETPPEAGMHVLWPAYVPDWEESVYYPLLATLAAAVGVGDPHGYDSPTDPFPTGEPRKFRRTSAFKRGARRGRYTKIRVIDLAAHAPQHRSDDEEREGTGRSVRPHFRRGHWRRVRVGHRDDWWYEPRWIHPVYVTGTGVDGDEALQVWASLEDHPD